MKKIMITLLRNILVCIVMLNLGAFSPAVSGEEGRETATETETEAEAYASDIMNTNPVVMASEDVREGIRARTWALTANSDKVMYRVDNDGAIHAIIQQNKYVGRRYVPEYLLVSPDNVYTINASHPSYEKINTMYTDGGAQYKERLHKSLGGQLRDAVNNFFYPRSPQPGTPIVIAESSRSSSRATPSKAPEQPGATKMAAGQGKPTSNTRSIMSPDKLFGKLPGSGKDSLENSQQKAE